MRSVSDEILKAIEYALDKQTVNCDKTYKSVIKAVNPNGTYVVLDDSGGNRTVKCCIPNLDLRVGQSVWVTAPMGKINDLHIRGVV